jgi:myb proto-oncogene protein
MQVKQWSSTSSTSPQAQAQAQAQLQLQLQPHFPQAQYTRPQQPQRHFSGPAPAVLQAQRTTQTQRTPQPQPSPAPLAEQHAASLNCALEGSLPASYAHTLADMTTVAAAAPEAASESSSVSFASGGDAGRRRWSAEEDERLRQAVQRLGDRKWKDIAAEVRTRDNVQCLQRWRKSIRPGLIKGAWQVDEDTLLRLLVAQKNTDSSRTWTWVSAQVPGRNAKQCRERWQNFLDTSIRRCAWTEKEDSELLALHKQLAGRWSFIAKELPGRTENSVKVRFQALTRVPRSSTASTTGKAPCGRSIRGASGYAAPCLASGC